MARECTCGSGLPRYDLTDARGIFCCYVCDECEDRKMETYRVEVFTDAAYEADEPIEEDFL